ncbi:molybdopterin synthase catalytic subunit [Phycisphaerales bacterium]|nr:molybdopterin synthase catalytic subunit [Phycisphaerales bacterium]
MTVLARIVGGAVTPACEAGVFARGEGIGAAVRFEGIVRRMEGEREIVALDYQTYDPMAERRLKELAGEIAARHGLRGIAAIHGRGRVAVGEVSFVLWVAAAHRAEALAAVEEFIDRLKRDVPIWKIPVWK